MGSKQPSFDGKASSLYVQSQMASSQYINSVRDEAARITFARATPASKANDRRPNFANLERDVFEVTPAGSQHSNRDMRSSHYLMTSGS